MAKIIIKIETKEIMFRLWFNQLMDIHVFMAVLPHRPTFIGLDRIIEMSESHVVGKKCYNE
jgi:UDP-3-O-[3-hydroxymyristoyl] N-acetylglucosamine deacetylase/3-hydroxyacyl-[acyl-carrier-protein] dehydratase